MERFRSKEKESSGLGGNPLIAGDDDLVQTHGLVDCAIGESGFRVSGFQDSGFKGDEGLGLI